jgi:spore coat protein A
MLVPLWYTVVSASFTLPVSAQARSILDPLSIPKWVNQLQGPPPVLAPENVTDADGRIIRQDYVVNITQFYQQILPTADISGSPTGFGKTLVWGYGGIAEDPVTGKNLGYVSSMPGPTFEVVQGIPTQVEWVNSLVDASGKPLPEMFPVDPTIMWANPGNINVTAAQIQAQEGLAPPYPPGYNGSSYLLPNGQTANPDGWNAQSPVPIVTHLHGGEDSSDYDGNPDAWYTPNGIHGPAYNSAVSTTPNAAVYQYTNSQEPTMLWYHDHALGLTRLHVYAGLCGPYIISPSDSIAAELPSGAYNIPLVIQDRSFYTDGSLYYPSEGDNPTVSPYSTDTFSGNTIMVNGKVWPNMNVRPGEYYFQILDGSNDLYYNLTFSNGMPFTQVATDGGYLKAAAPLTSLLIGPAERAGILVDFSNLTAGTKLVLQNEALLGNTAYEKQTIGQILQFTVIDGKGFVPKTLPSSLNPTLAGVWPTLPNPTKTRILTLIGTSGSNGSMPMYLDGQTWSSPISEKVVAGTTEDWVIVNPTLNAHQIHLHLVQFQVVQRQAFNETAYMTEWMSLNGNPPFDHPTANVASLTSCLIGQPTTPAPNEQGWKDTVQSFSGEVTVIRIRFAQQDGTPFPFDATAGPGYVWHCHLLEHEDNDMMRPYVLINPALNVIPEIVLITAIVLIVAAVLVFLFQKLFKLRKNRIASA